MSNGSTGNRLEDTLQDDDTGAAKHVLLVDPDGDVRKVVSDLLLDLGFRVSTAEDAATMRALLDRESIELIVLDASPSAPREADLALEAKENGIRLVMISGHPDVMKRFQDRADQLLWSRSVARD